MSDEKTYLGLTKPEFDNLMQAIRFGLIIVATVLITFTIVAGITGLLGYVPPPPSEYNPTVEATSFAN